jgi:hypothetical protein
VELDLPTLSVIVGAVVTGVVGALGGAKAVSAARAPKGEPAPEGPEPAESKVSKREAVELVKHAEAEATWRAEVRGKLDTLITRQGEHSAADERRFGEHEADLAELHRRWHSLNDKVTPLAIDVPNLRERIDETRRLAGIDSGVHDTRRRR